MGRVKVWMPEIPPLSPEAQRRAEKIMEWNLANPDLVKAHFDKYEPLEVIQKSQAQALEAARNFIYKEHRPRPASTMVYIPKTVIDTSAPTCATRGEDTMFKLLANADPSNLILRIINPATGIADDVFKASMIKRYRDDRGVAHKVPVTSKSILTDSSCLVALGGSLLKRPCQDPGESSETEVAASGTVHEVLPGASVLKRFREELGESSETVAADS